MNLSVTANSKQFATAPSVEHHWGMKAGSNPLHEDWILNRQCDRVDDRECDRYHPMTKTKRFDPFVFPQPLSQAPWANFYFRPVYVTKVVTVIKDEEMSIYFQTHGNSYTIFYEDRMSEHNVVDVLLSDKFLRRFYDHKLYVFTETLESLGIESGAFATLDAFVAARKQAFGDAADQIKSLVLDVVRAIPGGEGAYAIYVISEDSVFGYVGGRLVEIKDDIVLKTQLVTDKKAAVGIGGVVIAAVVGTKTLKALRASDDIKLHLHPKWTVNFTKEMLSTSEVIAKGSSIRKIDDLVEAFGGTKKGWVKKKGWDANGNEWHWYEHHGIGRKGVKPAGEPDPF